MGGRPLNVGMKPCSGKGIRRNGMSIPGVEQYPLRLDYRFSDDTVRQALEVTPEDVSPAETVTFCKNVFLPLTTACRYTCSYCTYFDVPGQASLMDEEELRRQLERGRKAGCREALFTFGDRPDDRYTRIHEQLHGRGYDSILQYLSDACRWALEEGLLPHSNPGDLTLREMEALREVNASMGVMLETTADVEAHSGPRWKSPAQRLRTLENAGELRVPFTTGLLVGIGESWRDRARSLLCIRKLHEEYGHIQEVIVQNVVPNRRSQFSRPDPSTMRRTVAMARSVLPEAVEVQVPPNLSPARELMDCGVGDLGGVSPVTDDYINPSYEWPQVQELEAIADEIDARLEERGPIYPRYISRPEWTRPRIRKHIDPSARTGANVASSRGSTTRSVP